MPRNIKNEAAKRTKQAGAVWRTNGGAAFDSPRRMARDSFVFRPDFLADRRNRPLVIPYGRAHALGLSLADRRNPALVIGEASPLNAREGVIEFLRDGADFAVADLHGVALPVQFLDGRHDRRRTRAEYLL